MSFEMWVTFLWVLCPVDSSGSVQIRQIEWGDVPLRRIRWVAV